jgi:prephenate dehydrogenase
VHGIGGSVFFKRIVIVGVGLIGGSMGLALKRVGFKGQRVGVSRSETLAEALRLDVVDQGYTYEELGAALEGADLVLLCTPIERILSLLPEVGRLATPGALVTDVGSTKRRIDAEARRVLGAELLFVGGHPMAGSEKAGVGAADPFLFQNAIYILVPPPGKRDARYAALVELLHGVGARTMELTVAAHDQVVAAVSHLPQLMATSLVEMVGRLNEQHEVFLPLAAGGFRDMTRIASSPFAPVWRDICRTNADQIDHMIGAYIETLEAVRQRLGADTLGANFDYANEVRATIPKDVKGFIHPLAELLVVAEDRPGIIAEMSAGLALAQVNISDIEVVKVREGEGGTIRLGFDSEATVEAAQKILEDHGFDVRRP